MLDHMDLMERTVCFDRENVSDSAWEGIWDDPNEGAAPFLLGSVQYRCFKVLETVEGGLLINYHFSAAAAMS